MTTLSHYEPVIYELVPLLLQLGRSVLLLQREIMFPAAPIAGLPVRELDEHDRGGERDAWWVGATKAPSNKRVKAAGEPELPRALCK